MAVSLHEQGKGSLILALSRALPSVDVEDNYRPTTESMKALSKVDSLLASNKNLAAEIRDATGEVKLSEFFESEIRRDLYPRPIEEGNICKLVEIEGFTNPLSYADSLVDRLASLPWRYTLHHPLPMWMSGMIDDGEEFEVFPGVSFVRTNSSHISKYNSDGQKNVYLVDGKPYTFSGYSDSLWVRMECEGYVDHRMSSSTARNIDAEIRTIIGILLVDSAIWYSAYADENLVDPVIPIHRSVNGSWLLDCVDNVPRHLARTLKGLGPNKARDHDALKSLFKSSSETVRKIKDGGEAGQRLSLAARWYFDSVTGDSPLLSYIQAMIVLEIILGDRNESNRIGLSDLIKNRCAYLIGQSQEDRDQIISRFPELYKVRSNIVHSGKDKLSENEVTSYKELLSYCRRVMIRERQIITNSRT